MGILLSFFIWYQNHLSENDGSRLFFLSYSCARAFRTTHYDPDFGLLPSFVMSKLYIPIEICCFFVCAFLYYFLSLRNRRHLFLPLQNLTSLHVQPNLQCWELVDHWLLWREVRGVQLWILVSQSCQCCQCIPRRQNTLVSVLHLLGRINFVV